MAVSVYSNIIYIIMPPIFLFCFHKNNFIQTVSFVFRLILLVYLIFHQWKPHIKLWHLWSPKSRSRVKRSTNLISPKIVAQRSTRVKWKKVLYPVYIRTLGKGWNWGQTDKTKPMCLCLWSFCPWTYKIQTSFYESSCHPYY